MTDAGLAVQRDHRVMTCTIQREKQRNTLTGEVVQGLMEALSEAEQDPDVRVVCLTGAGDRVFCAGADLSGTMRSPGEAFRAFADLMVLMESMATPLVARINGHCAGGGVGLVLGCDIAIAVDDATFATPETRIGLFPMMIGPLMLRHLGRRRTWDMILTGRKVGAAEAERFQLVTRAVPRARLDDAVAETLDAIATAGPEAVARGRRALLTVEGASLREAEDRLLLELEALASGPEAAEGIAAFLEKRTPSWNEE